MNKGRAVTSATCIGRGIKTKIVRSEKRHGDEGERERNREEWGGVTNSEKIGEEGDTERVSWKERERERLKGGEMSLLRDFSGNPTCIVVVCEPCRITSIPAWGSLCRSEFIQGLDPKNLNINTTPLVRGRYYTP